MSKSVFIIYDGRVCGGLGDTFDAAVLCCADTLDDARRDARGFGFECAIYQYDLVKHAGKDEPEAMNERWVEDFHPPVKTGPARSQRTDPMKHP